MIALSQKAIRELQSRFAGAVGEATKREDGPLLYVRIEPVDAALISYLMGCADAMRGSERKRKTKRAMKGKT
jgi:hypothetical protein